MSELNYLAHYQVKGAKHGVRRYQNYDGSLTPLGRVHYGVGEARKKVEKKVTSTREKAGNIIKSAPKNISKAVKKTARDLSRQRVRSAKAAQKRKVAKQKQKEERLARKIADKAAKTRIAKLKEEFDEAKMERARQKVTSLAEKNERIQEAAFLKAQERLLKRENKRLKKTIEKDTEKSLSKKQIAQLTDEEIDFRLSRLKKEAELAGYEAKRLTPTVVDKLTDELIRSGSQAVGSVVKDLGSNLVTSLGKKYLGLNEPVATAHDRAQRYKDTLDELKSQKDLEDWVKNFGKVDADEELAKEARRAQNRQTIANANKTLRDIEEASKNKPSAEDEELAKEARRYQNLQTIANAKKAINPKPSAEDKSKDFARKVAERKEDERRAQSFYKNGEGLSISEIASRMGLTENQVKDLLYK